MLNEILDKMAAEYVESARAAFAHIGPPPFHAVMVSMHHPMDGRELPEPTPFYTETEGAESVLEAAVALKETVKRFKAISVLTVFQSRASVGHCVVFAYERLGLNKAWVFRIDGKELTLLTESLPVVGPISNLLDRPEMVN